MTDQPNLSFTYKIYLTPEDAKALRRIGDHYEWAYLLPQEVGHHELSESEAWEWKEQADRNAQGGHGLFIMCHPGSPLFAKLHSLYDSIV